MALAKEYTKHIFCIESEFDNDLKHESTSKFMLEQMQNLHVNKLKFIYRKCATKAELTHYFKKMSLKKYKDYSIIYLSLHGKSNKICLDNEDIDLIELAEIVGPKSLSDKIVHFSSCETIKISKKELKIFIDKTNSLAVSGFTKEVNYVEALALEMLFFNLCQEYKNLKSLENKMSENYSGIIKNTGFEIIQRN
ncbi:DUF6642 family protein [Maribacter sp. Asnod2-G09]|uniref:DUF6642 family protein n=1 Tax=Maribacter sp. Asnod2-G09 TaxID=3160577 RepID=UPI003866D84F